MVQYHVFLKRFKGSTRPDVCIFYDEDREAAIREMQRYCKKNGFSIYDSDGHFTITDIVLVAKEPIVGAPVISTTSYHELFDVCGERRKTDDDT